MSLNFSRLRKKKTSLMTDMPPIIKSITSINESTLSDDSHRKIDSFIRKYDLKFLENIFAKATNDQKIKYLSEISFKVCTHKETVLNLNFKKKTKQILVLLSGELEYKMTVCDGIKNTVTHQHPSKCGQILNQPTNLQIKNRAFSIVTKKQSLLMIIPKQSTLSSSICRQKSQNINYLHRYLQNLMPVNSQISQSLNLLPFFVETNFAKNQYLLQQFPNCDWLCLILNGDLQIVKQSSAGRQLGIVQMSKGEAVVIRIEKGVQFSIRSKCKSNSMSLYVAPLPILKQIVGDEVYLTISLNAKNTQSLCNKIFYKNQKIMKNPASILKKYKKRTKSKKKSYSLKNQQSWDLIEHFTMQMRMKQPRLSKTRHCKSTYIRETDKPVVQRMSSVDNLIRKIRIEEPAQIQQQQNQLKNVGMTTALKSPLNCQSNFLKSINKISFIKPNQQNRFTLVKKTKYKLLRYAKGHNLYTLDDYF